MDWDAVVDSFTGCGAVGEEQAGLDVLGLELGVLLEIRFDGVAGGQHTEHVFHGDSHVADDWLAAEDVGAHRYPFEQIGVRGHRSGSSWAAAYPQPSVPVSPRVMGRTGRAWGCTGIPRIGAERAFVWRALADCRSGGRRWA